MSEKLIKVQCLRTIKSGGAWRNPGTKLDLDEETAKALYAITNPSPVIQVLSDVDWAEEVEEVEETSDSDSEAKAIAIEEMLLVESLTEEWAEALYGLGITSLEDLQQASVDQLTPIKGIGKATAKDIIDEANELEIGE